MTLSTPRSTSAPRLLGSSHAAADANTSARRDPFDDVFIRAGADSGIEIDDLNHGNAANLSSISCGLSPFERFFAALHELHDFAVHADRCRE